MHDPLLVRLTDTARLADAHHEATRRRWLAGVAVESASLVGTLVDLAESGRAVTLERRSGRRHSGSLALVGADFVVVDGAAGQLWCRLAAIVAVRVAGRPSPPTGDRPGLDLRFDEALALLVEDQPRVVFDLVGGELVAGTLEAVGADVLTVRPDGDDLLYVPSSSVDAVLRSG